MFLPKMLLLNLLGCYVSASGCYVKFLDVLCFLNRCGNSKLQGKLWSKFWKNTS